MYLSIAGTIWIISILVLLILLYVLFVTMSFYFMHVFKKKLNIGKESINVLIYQKITTLYECANNLLKLGYDNPKLIEFIKNEELRKYRVVEVKEFEGLFSKTEEIYATVKKVCTNLKREDNYRDIVNNLETIDNLNSKYFETIQLYNTYVVGFNYWRNLYFTRWIKVLLRKDEIDTIK